MNNIYQQAHLAKYAPDQSLDKYKKGADPRVINGIMALSELQDRAADRAHASMAAGAASGQMPTVRDKIMQMFQQSNQQQPQQQPNPMMQRGIAAQARPPMQTAPMPQEEVPEEAQMYHGGVARLPVNNRMFGYANGGIIAFADGDKVPRPIGEETPLDPKERAKLERELLMRLIGETERAQYATPEPAPAPQQPRPPVDMGAADQDLGAAITGAAQAEREPEIVRAIKTPFRALGEGIKSLYRSAPGTEPSPVGTADQDLGAAIMAAAGTERPAAPVRARSPEQIDLEKRHRMAVAAGDSSLSPTRKGIAQNVAPPPGAPAASPAQGTGIAQNVASPTAPTPPAARPVAPPVQAASTGIDALLAQQAQRLQAQANGPKMPEPDVVEGGLKYLKAQDDYVRKTGDSEAAKKLYSLYDKMAQRATADDNAQLAQKAEDARNNLWTYLANTRGSSLGVAAGKADAALQPLLSEQKKAAAEYRKYSYERDMNREKAHAEAMAAEEARKRGDFAKAVEHEKNERAYRLEVRKADQLAEHYRNTEMGQLLSTAATRESAKEGHLTQIQVAQITSAATRAGHPDYVAEYDQRVKRDGKAAADKWLEGVGKVLGVTKGFDTKEGSLNVAKHKEVRTSLENDQVYNSVTRELNKLEKAALKKPLDKEQTAYLQRLRARQQELYNNKYRELHGEAPTATPSAGEAGGAGAAPQRVTTPEEYAKLPPNTRFIAPDGSIRVKP